MSKKRGRSTAAKVDEGPDASFAEELLFQLASDADETHKPPPKRGKSSSSAKPHPTFDNQNNNNGTITDPTGGGDDDAGATAEDGSASADPSGPANGKHPAAIRPSSALRHCDGFDVVRKGSRGRGRQLMVLPGTLGLGGGSAGGTAAVKLGTLNTASPGCPVLYVEFPEGRLKCMGRTVHTKGRFFTLYADKVGKRATRMDCRDVFDSVVFFGKACWLGKKEDNPEDEPLPLPESLHFLPEEASGGGEAALKTHFGGGNPGCLLTSSSSNKKNENGVAGTDPDQADDAGDNDEEDGESAEAAAAAAVAAAPARRSNRSTKSTATYVEDSNDSENDDDSGSSSSSGSDNDNDNNEEDGDSGGGVRQGPKFSAVVKEKAGGAKEGVEVFSILDAPTAKRKPVTIGSGKVESVKKATPAKKGGGKNGPMSSGKGKGKGKGRRAAGSSDGEGASGEEGGSSDEDGSAGGVVVEPSRRSSRASAVTKVKYTQSSGSEEEEEEEDDDDDEEEF